MQNQPTMYNTHRREFLKQASLACAALAITGGSASAAAPAPAPGAGLPRRPLGKTGIDVSIVGVAGYHLGKLTEQTEAMELVQSAVDAGINLFETAWEYQDGRNEQLLGEALAGRRDKVVLASQVCTHGRDKSVGLQQLEDSLSRLKTDHLDLWLIHEVIYWNDPEWATAKDGVVEALRQARQQGKVRAVGFSGHKDPRITLKMLGHDFPFDVVVMPLNPFDFSYRSFEQQVLPELARRQIAAIGEKSLGGDLEPIQQGAITVEEGLRYAMSLPAASTLAAIESKTMLRTAISLAENFRPMSEPELSSLRQRVAPLAGDGHLELYKSTKKYDQKVGRVQHGFQSEEELPL